MKKRLFLNLCTLLLFINTTSLFSQVSGIGYTISPLGEYTWWDNKAGLEDGFAYGGKLGIAFGENLELRGTYHKYLNLKTRFSDFGLANYSDSLFTAREVDMNRWGGELKANLSRGKLLPYLTLGTGIQSIKLDTFNTNKQIYVSLGAGIKLSAGDRYTLTLEAKNTQYNFNTGRNLLSPEDKETFGVTDDDFETDRLGNWSVSAALQFYLGGRRPGEMSELDKAYFQTYTDGLKGLRFPIELTLGKMNFADKLPYRDTWLAGVHAGFDFSPYVGVRGFYLQALEDGDLTTSFDPLSMYGGEIRMKMNVSRGVTPYLMVGGGYLNVGDDYEATDTSSIAESQAFALGGVGINLPLSNRLKLFGAVRAHLTTGSNVEELQTTDEIQTSWMYSFGVNLTLGQKSANTNDVVKSEIDAALLIQQEQNEAEAAKLKQEYEQKVLDLEKQLNEAYAQADVEKAAAILQEKETAEQIVNELKVREEEREAKAAAAETERIEKVLNPTTPQRNGFDIIPSNGRIQMTPAEFENLIEEILENMGDGGQRISPAVEQQIMGQQNMQQMLQQQEMDRRFSEMEKLLIQMNERQSASGQIAQTEQTARDESIRRDLTEFSAKLLNEINRLNDKVDKNNAEIQSIRNGNNNAIQPNQSNNQPNETKPNEPVVPTQSVTSNNVLGVETGGKFVQQDTGFFSKLVYEGMSGFAGFNIGGQTTLNMGFRWHYGLKNSKFELMPEAFFGFGSPSAFGLTLNGILPVELKNTPITPYVGAGAGFMQIAENGDDKLRLNYNFIFGSYLNVGKGRLYVDFTARNLFKFNQIIAGYRFPF